MKSIERPAKSGESPAKVPRHIVAGLSLDFRWTLLDFRCTVAGRSLDDDTCKNAMLQGPR